MRNKYCNRLAVGILSATMLFGCVGTLPGRAATEHWNDASSSSAEWTAYKESWSTISTNYENVSLTPGADQSKLNFAWYSKTKETPKVRIATSEDALEQGTVFEGSGEAITLENLTGYYSNKVTVSDLKENTTYYYQVYQDGKWQDAKTYQTKSFDSYSFLYVGDPQIGACTKQTSTEKEKMSEDETAGNYAARNDSYNWEKTLNNALANHPEVSFMVSAGDQVNTANSETEYAGYLGASALSSLPVATTIGNHDSKSSQYSLHYNNPNSFDTTDTANEAYTTGATAAGSDYYYTYGDVLFIVLDTNNYNCSTHESVTYSVTSGDKTIVSETTVKANSKGYIPVEIPVASEAKTYTLSAKLTNTKQDPTTASITFTNPENEQFTANSVDLNESTVTITFADYKTLQKALRDIKYAGFYTVKDADGNELTITDIKVSETNESQLIITVNGTAATVKINPSYKDETTGITYYMLDDADGTLFTDGAGTSGGSTDSTDSTDLDDSTDSDE